MMLNKRRTKVHNSPPETLKLSEIQEATNNFNESLLIGRGFYGDVYKGEVPRSDGVTSVVAAIKRLNFDAFLGRSAYWPEDEIESQRLPTLRHPNLVQLIGYFCSDAKELEERRKRTSCRYTKETVLVFEYIPNSTTLKDHLYNQLYVTPSFIQRLNILMGVARGLRYLHQGGIVHGDVRRCNVFLTEKYLVPKLSEFGLMSKIVTEAPTYTYPVFSPRARGYLDVYAIMSGAIMTMTSDVYSFGVVLLEVLCRMPPVDDGDVEWRLVQWFQRSLDCIRKVAPPNTNTNTNYIYARRAVVKTELVDLIDQGINKNDISPDCVEPIFEIAEACLHERPSSRPSMVEVVRRLESVLTSQEAFIIKSHDETSNNPSPPRSSVKQLTSDDLLEALTLFGQPLPLPGIGGPGNMLIGWVMKGTLASSQGGNRAAIAVTMRPLISKVPESHDEWLEDVNFMRQFSHPNVIQLLAYGVGVGNEHSLLYENVRRSLSNVICGGYSLEPLPWRTRLNILIGVARGLAYLYMEKGVVCDFHCSDIVLDEDSNAKLGGFGWIEIQLRHDKRRLKGYFGYPRANGCIYNDTGRLFMMDDIFSFGMVVLETITGRRPENVLEDLESLKMRPPMSKSDKKKLKKLIDPRLKDNYSRIGALKCLGLASRCVGLQLKDMPSREEILWTLEQISHL